MFKNKFIFLTIYLGILGYSQSIVTMEAENPTIYISPNHMNGKILFSQFANPSKSVARCHIITKPKKMDLLCNIFEGNCSYVLKTDVMGFIDELILKIYYENGSTEIKRILIIRDEEKA